MLNLIRSKGAILKTALLIGALVATSLTFFITQMEKTYASSQDKKICVTATLISDPSISYKQGACAKSDASKPSPVPTVGSTPTSTPSETPSSAPTVEPSTSPEPVVTDSSTLEPTQTNPTVDLEPSVTPTPTGESSPVATISPTPTQTPLTSPTPVPTNSQSPQPTATPSPTPTAETIPDIPPENKDPKTKEFRFCHNGSPMSNSYTGMMNGHHGNHPEDIIPPIPFKFYGGWNWTTENAKAFYNNCVPV